MTKISDSIGNYYRPQYGIQTSGGAGAGLPQSVESVGQRRSAPTISSGLDTSAASLSSALWRSIADQADSDASRAKVAANNKSVADEFMTWADMTPAEKIRAQILEKNELTEESLAALPPEEREAIEAEIEQAIKKQLGFEQDDGVAATGAENAAA